MTPPRSLALSLLVLMAAARGMAAQGTAADDSAPESVVSAESGAKIDFTLGAEPALRSLMALTEERIRGTRLSLRLLAATEEARSGDWERLRDLMAQMPAAVGGMVWYARPDGVYYTADRGLMAQRLSDRSYFARLLAGQEVVGELIVSRSTRRRAAVVAVPVREGGKVVGAVGASLFLDELSRMLDERTGLPENILFYALDSEGRAVLHRDPRLLFLLPSALGSPSLSTAVQQMLSRKAGIVRYDFHGRSKALVFRESPATGWRFALGTEAAQPELRSREQALEALVAIRNSVSAALERLDAGLERVAEEAGRVGLGPKSRPALARLCRENPVAVDCALVDAGGTLAVIEPSDYSSHEGANISQQEQVALLRRSKRPVLSSLFRSVEGLDAVDLERPVFSGPDRLAGSASVLFRPEILLLEAVVSSVKTAHVEAWAAQTNGRLLYDGGRPASGRELMAALGGRISAEETGNGTYESADGAGPARREAVWATVGIHDTRWRLVVTRRL